MKRKKFMSIIMALVMVLAMVPSTAFAATDIVAKFYNGDKYLSTAVADAEGFVEEPTSEPDGIGSNKFDGWYVDSNGDDKYTDGEDFDFATDKITQDTDLHAKWLVKAGYNVYNADDLGSKVGTLNAEWTVQGSGYSKWRNFSNVEAYAIKKGWATDKDIMYGLFDKATYTKIKKGTLDLKDAVDYSINLSLVEAVSENAYYAIISTTPATTHDVTFKYSAKDADGNYYEVAPDEIVSVVEGETVEEPTIPNVEGGEGFRYEFDGWYAGGVEYEAGEPFDFNGAIDAATDVYGMFRKVETVTITFNAGEHGDFDGEQTVDVVIAKGGAVDTVPALTINGTYALLGWQMSVDGSPTEGLYDTEFLETGAHLGKNVTFTAQYENTDKVTITFDANGGTLPWNRDEETYTSDLLIAGTTIAEFGGIGTDPVRDGWIFVGWFDADGNAVDNDTVIASTMTITAKWKKAVTYFVCANGDFDNYVTSYNIEVEDGKAYPEVNLVETGAAKDSDTILGWYERTPWVTAKRANDVTLLTPDVVADLSTTNTVELFAMVIDGTITDVTFNPNNGNDVVVKSGKTIGEAFGEAIDTGLTKENRTFAGWYYTNADGVETSFDETTLVTANMEVYAKWNKTTRYYVIADDITSDNYIYNSELITIDENDSFEDLDVTTVTDKVTSKDLFIGWYDHETWVAAKKANDIKLLTNDNKADLSTVTSELFAYVITDGNLEEFTVTYDLNGVEATPIENKTVKDGSVLGEAGNVTPENVQPGKNFLYWKAQGVSGKYDFTAPVTENITLIAVWENATYGVDILARYDNNLDKEVSGVGYEAQNVLHGEYATEPEIQDALGYNFLGWYDSYETSANVFEFATTEITAPTTVYAMYDNVGTAAINFAVGENGTTADETSFTITKGGTVTAPVVTANDGFEFLYWQCGTGIYTNEDVNALHLSDDLSFTAIYEDTNAVTVTFDPNNGMETSEVPAVKGNAIAAEYMPEIPVKADRTFMGWFAADGTEFTAETVVSDNVLVTAKWGKTLTYRVYKDFNFDKPYKEFSDLIEETLIPSGVDLIAAEIEGEYLATVNDTVYGWFTNNEWNDTINKDKDILIATTPSAAKVGTKIMCAMVETEGELEDYTVTYDLNGVTADAIEAKTVKATKFAENITPTNVEAGKVFDYWKEKGVSGRYDFATPVSDNLELIAVWKDVEFNVTYVAVDDSQTAVPNVDYSASNGKVKYDATIAEAPTTQEEVGYVFKGWYTDDAGTNAFTFGTDKITAETTLYAVYENKGVVTVTFDLDGKGTTTDLTTIEVTKGSKVTVPTVIPNDEYEFAYWVDSIGDKVENIGDIEFLINETFKATYTEKEITVTFDLQHVDVENETDFAAPVTVKYGEDVTAPTPVPTSRYFEFAGWYTDAACTVGNEFNFTEVKVSSTAYAKWNAIKTYKVNFIYSLSETVLSDFNEEVEADIDSIAVPTATLPEGYRVSGWQKMSGGKLVDTDVTAFNKDTTLYAKLDVEVSLNVYKNNGATPDETLSKSVWITKGATAYADASYDDYADLSGMNVYGWYTDAELDNFRNGLTAKTIEKAVANTPIAFNKVANEVYTVTFDSTFDEPASPASQNIEHYNNVDATGLTLEKTGYRFNGWKVSGTDDVITVEVLAVVPIESNMDLVADWTPTKQAVHFVTGEYCDAITDYSVDYDSKITAPTTENVKDGYRFVGWYADKDLTTEFDFTNTAIKEETTIYAKWEVGTTFNVYENYDAVTPVDTYTVWTQLGTGIESQDIAKYADDTFHGWFSEAGWTELNATNSDKTFETAAKVADWTAKVPFTASAMVIKNYTVKFTNEVGIVLINDTVLPEDQTVAYEKAATEPTAIMERNGWDFDKWLLNGAVYDFSAPVTEDITLVSSWIPTARTVSFDAYGIVTVENQVIDNKGAATEPEVEMPEGYELVGWYTDKELTKPYNFGTEVTESFTLYAKINVTVNYHVYTNTTAKEDTALTQHDVKVLYNTLAPSEEVGEEKDSFHGWFTQAGWDSLKNFSTPTDYQFSSAAKMTEWTVTEPLDVYAMVIENYTVAFTNEPNVIATDMPEAQIVAYAGKATAPTTTPVRAGYTFVGWYVGDLNDNARYNFADLVTSDITLTAKWEASQFEVTFDANGGKFKSGVNTVKNVTYLKPYGVLLEGNTMVNGNGTFAGWFTDAEGTTEVTSESIYKATTATTLYAKWEKSQCEVVYVTNGGDEIPAEYVESGDTITNTEATRENFVFEGWYTDEALTEKFDVTTPIRSTSITLYAKWQVEVTFVAYTNYSDVQTKVVTVDENADLEEVALSELGITMGAKDQFDGWYTDAEFAKYQNGEAATAYTFDKATEKLTLTGNVLRNYVVTLNYKDDTNKVETQDVLFNQTAMQPDPNPTKTGYRFTRWVAEGEDATYDFTAPVKGNLVINARWTINEYPVTFVMQDGTEVIENVEYNKAIDADKVPNTTVDGYIFMGWFVEGSETAFDLDMRITEAITLTGVWKLDVSQFNVTFTPGNNIYNGSVQKTNVKVSLGEKTLVEGTDYEVVYTIDGVKVEPINASQKYVITVNGIGECSGTKTAEDNYIINRKNIDVHETIEASVADLVYTGAELTPVLTISDTETGKALVVDVDYTVASIEPSTVKNVGEYTYTITGIGNYKADKALAFEVTPKSISLATVAPIDAVDYDGTAKTPVVVVTDGGATLVAGTDYEVMPLSNNTDAGTVTIVIAGRGNYDDTKLVNFTINARTLVGNATIADIADQDHTGNPVEPVVVVTDSLLGTLVEGRDYSVSYENNVSGTATVTVTGIGNFSGSISKTFEIGHDLYYITGIVRYSNGRIIRNATVKLVGTDLDGNEVSLTTRTDASGRYRFDDLRYGNYTVSYLKKSQTGILNEQ